MADLLALRTFLVQARARTDASQFPQLRAQVAQRDPRGRRRAGLTQAHMDTLLGRTTGTYGDLERGAAVRPGLLKDTARILQLTHDEWRTVWAWAFSTEPSEALAKPPGLLLGDRWQAVLDSMTSMASICDAEGQILAYNEPFRALFGPRPVPANWLRWTTVDPTAREVLIDWPTHWAPASFARFRTALALHNESQHLNELLQEILADEETARLYETAGSTTSMASQAAARRPVRHSTWGDGWVTLCTANPTDTPGTRLYIAPFTPED